MAILAPSIPHVREKKFRGKIKTRIKRRAKFSVGFIPLFDCTKKKKKKVLKFPRKKRTQKNNEKKTEKSDIKRNGKWVKITLRALRS